MALSNQELVKRGYPLRPDPQKSPGAYASWLKAVSKPATFIPPKTVNVEGRNLGPVKLASVPAASVPAASVPDPSAASSGYILTGPSSPFDFIEGEWNVPAIVGAEEGTDTSSFLWIGLDGFGSDNIVSDGTAQDVFLSDGVTYSDYYPWKEICCQEGVVALSNFSVNPGDEIYAQVFMGDTDGNLNPNGGYGYFLFDDITTGQYTRLSTQFNSGTFTGNSAEWILGRSGANGIYPDLADYWFAVMQSPFAYTGDYTAVNYLSGGDGATIYQATMYNGNDVLSTVYPINNDTMEFVWMNYN